MMNTPRLRRPLTGNTTLTPRQVPRHRPKPSLNDTGPVPPIPARMKLLALVLALSVNYVAYYGNKIPKEASDAQRPRIRRLWGLATQVGDDRLTIER